MLLVLKNLNTAKASHSFNISTKILRQNVDFYSPFILDYVNKSISSPNFPSILKLADIIRIYKKDSPYEKSKYWPISVLSSLSKIFENVLYDQISSFLKKIFSKYQTAFRKGFTPQRCLLAMIQKFNKSLDQGGEYASVLMHSYLTVRYRSTLIIPIAIGVPSNMECLKVQFWVPCYLIYFYSAYSLW